MRMLRRACASCGGPVTQTGEGLGTWRCQQHPYRMVTVTRDLSGGKEAARELRRSPVTVRRHTKVVTVCRELPE